MKPESGSKNNSPLIGFHETKTDLVPKIRKEGIRCKSYPDHPMGGDKRCLVFLYPIEYIRKAVSYWPKNAEWQGIDNLDSLSILAVNVEEEATVGDLILEDQPERYKASAQLYRDYITHPHRFEEAEIVVPHSISPDKIIGAMVYSKFISTFDQCQQQGNFHACLYNAFLNDPPSESGSKSDISESVKTAAWLLEREFHVKALKGYQKPAGLTGKDIDVILLYDPKDYEKLFEFSFSDALLQYKGKPIDIFITDGKNVAASVQVSPQRLRFMEKPPGMRRKLKISKETLKKLQPLDDPPMDKEFILLVSEECKACDDIKSKIGPAEGVKTVELTSNEGYDLLQKLNRLHGIPAVIEKSGEDLATCELYSDGERIVAKCPSGEKEL